MPVASSIDLCVVVVYLVLVTALGCIMCRKTHSAADFISAGGTLPAWVVGFSIIGTFVSSISFIASPGKTYASTWNPFVFSLTLPYAAWVAARYFVPFFRNCGSLSAYEHLEHRFGAWSRLYAAGFNVLYHVGRIGTVLFSVALAVSALIDVPVAAIIVVIGLLVIAYTLMGGIEAVIWTDVVQSIILIGGIVVCVVMLVWTVPGGFMGIITGAQTPVQNKLSLGSMALDFSQSGFWTVLVFGFFINVQNFAADQTYVQRYFTAKSENAAIRSLWMGALAYLPISAMLFFIGTGLYVFYHTTGQLPPETPPDEVFPYFIMHELPHGVAGLMIAAILAAAMSTVDSSLNSSAALLLCDVRNRFFLPASGGNGGNQQSVDRPYRSPDTVSADDRADLRFLRLMTMILGLAGIAAALAMIGVRQMLDLWWQVSGVLSGGTLGLILLARFTNVRGPVASAAGVLAGVSGILVIVLSDLKQPPDWLLPICNFLQPIKSWVHPLMAIVVGTLLVVITAMLVSLCSRRSSA